MIRSLLVPLDGSAYAEHALPLAASIARRAGASLRLIRVLPPLADTLFWAPLPGDPLEIELRESHKAEARTYLENLVARLGREGAGLATCDVVEEKQGITESI